jgi:hypothetical protein
MYVNRLVPGCELVRIGIGVSTRIRAGGTKSLLRSNGRERISELGENGAEQVDFFVGSAFGNAAGEGGYGKNKVAGKHRYHLMN